MNLGSLGSYMKPKIHREQSSQAGSLLSENPLKSDDLASLKMLT